MEGEDLTNYLQYWNEDKKGFCQSVSLDELKKIILQVTPVASILTVVRSLEAENLIENDVYGKYQLTEKGLEHWQKLSHRKLNEVVIDERHCVSDNEWINFKNLLSFYIQCVQSEELPNHLLFPDNRDISFFLPERMERNWLRPLDEIGDTKELTIPFKRKDRNAIHRFYSKLDENQEVYLGYPLLLDISRKEKPLIVPVGVIPVKVKSPDKPNAITFELQMKHCAINNFWLECKLNKKRKKGFLHTISTYGHKEENRGLVDLFYAVQDIYAESDISKLHSFDPNLLDQILPDTILTGKSSLSNTVVFYVISETRYTKSLIRELKYISSLPGKVLDQTALAYVYRKTPLVCSARSEKNAIPFIESNQEQIEAVEGALNNSIFKICGPPGTGKSQVATNLIANCQFYGESVLFTSKNHKAVDAIRDRADSLFAHKIPLIQFCSVETDKFPSNPWYGKDTEIEKATLSLLNDYAYAKDLQLLNNTLQAYTEIKERFALEDAASRRLCLALQAESQSCQKFLDALKEPNIDTLNLSYETSVIKQHSKNLSFSKHNGIFFLIWHLFRQKKHDKAVAFFKAAYPQFYTACIEGKSKETIRIAIDNCIGLYTQYRKDIIERQSAWQQVEIQNKDTATEKNGLKQILMQLNKSATGAYLEKRHEDGERITEEEMSSISSLQAKFRNKEELYLLQSSKPTDIAIMKGTFSKFQEICPAWAMSLLSLKYTAPCLPAIFDQVVIDEAAQCDVVSIIPALFRAKRACFMGDTKQLQPILNMSQEQHDYLFCHERLQSLEKFQYLHNSAYQAMPGKSIMLKEHFRCNEDIVNFENDMFYANQLRGRTANKVFHYPSNLGFKRGIEWLDVKNNYEKELLKAVSYVQLLVSNKYEGMVGILSPLRRVVDELKEMLQQKKLDGDTITCNTISSFQGGECDVIIFVLAYNDEIICTRGKAWYITDSSNWYLYNVAISRAKALLLVVGDRERCRNSNIKVLEKLAEYPKTKTISNISRPRFESIWEERFFNVLKNNGITCLTQYEVPSVGRRLDLAYIDTIKIDIEIDGAKFHQDSFGNRKIDDYMRDAQLEACGWQICRFWVSELMEDIEGCAKEVVKRIQKDNSRGLHS